MFNESFDAYASRLYRNAKEYGLSCEEIARILNKESGGAPKGESAYRKFYSAFNRGRDYERSIMQDELDDQFIVDLRSEQEKLRKERVRLGDQRREYNKILAHDARMDQLYEDLRAAANRMTPFELVPLKKDCGCCEAVIFVNDVHYGMRTNNPFNEYNTEICEMRFQRYAERVTNYIKKFDPKKVHVVVLGDLIHGCIHSECRVVANETTVDQLMRVSELLAQFINIVRICGVEVDVHCTYGNHARTQQNKSESQYSDNLEKFVPFWLKERFRGVNNIKIVDNELDGFIHFDIYGWGFIATHGDLEKPETYGMTMRALFAKRGWDVDYAIMADRHHYEAKDMVGIETIICPAMCGVDDYANNHRLYSSPAQMMMIVTEQGGAEGRFNIRF